MHNQVLAFPGVVKDKERGTFVGPGEPGRAGVRVFAGDAETVTDPGGRVHADRTPG
jgi:hypothetical protein